MSVSEAAWSKTACILCECNCGIEVQLDGPARSPRSAATRRTRRSQGYTCNKALRLDHYQNGRAPADRRRCAAAPTARFEEIDWDTAITRGRRAASRRSATRTAASRSSTTAAAGRATTSAAPTAARSCGRSASRYRSSALAQEKTGECWVDAPDARQPHRAATSSTPRWRSSSARTRGSRTSFPRARVDRCKEIAKDPARSMIVIDPVLHRDRRARRLPPAGAARAPTPGAWRRWSACSSRRTWSTTRSWPSTSTGVERRARRRSRGVDVARLRRAAAASTRTLIRAAARRIGGRRERRRVRGPRHPAGAATARCARTSTSCCGS